MEQSKKIDTILNCFVDLNLETNENFLYSNFSAKKISFEKFIYSVDEGGSVKIKVGLDSPSEYGIEKLDIEFYDTSSSLNGLSFFNDSQLVNREQFSFSAGEQYKTRSILRNIEENFEFKKIGFKLIDPAFVKITTSQLYNQGQIVLTDNSYNVLYSTFVIDDIFKQKGKIYDGITSSLLELRYFSQNSTIVSSNSRQIASWLVRYNFMYEDHFNDSIRQEMANYTLYPNFSFKSMKLIVTNKGEFAVEYDGKIYDTDQSFEFDLSQNMNSITLPTNTNPITDLPSDVSSVSGI